MPIELLTLYSLLQKHETGLLLFVLAFLILIVIQRKGLMRRNEALFNGIEKGLKELTFAHDDKTLDIENKLTDLNLRIKGILDNKQAQISSDIKELEQSIARSEATGSDNLEKIRALFEKHGVFLHDRFGELAAGEEQRRQEMRQIITESLAEQKSGLDAIHNLVRTQTEREDKTVEQLRQSVTSQVAELILKERNAQQESQKQMISLISDSINRLTGEVDAKLSLITDKVSTRFNENLASTMQSFQSLQQQIDAFIAAKNDIDLLGRDVTSLTRLILNKESGGITSGHLPDMLAAMLPDDSYLLNPVINGHPAAAQLMLPGEQGAVVIDNNFPTQGFDAIIAPDSSDSERQEARQRFDDSLHTHINKVADCFIAPPLTGNSVLLFIPSEIIFAEIQAHHKNCASLAAERQVWLVSPVTLAAALNMARSALKDQRARDQLEQMRQALQHIAHEAQNFEARLLEIGDHVNNAMRSVQRAESAGMKLFSEVRSVSGNGGRQQPQPALPGSVAPPSSPHSPPPDTAA